MKKFFGPFFQKRTTFLLVLCVAGCGDLPRPFAGNPGRRAMMLAMPPPPKLMVPTPADGLLPQHDAQVWSHAMTDALVAQEVPAFAGGRAPGNWVLRLSATLEHDQVVPHYGLLDSAGKDRGNVVGHPVPAAVWAQGSAGALGQAASEAAPQILALLRSVDANIKQSDPNSLYNRPAKIYFSGVTGAPGDGDVTLAHGMRGKLPDTGDQLVDTAASADYLLRGTVKITDEPGGQQQVEVRWLVNDRAGREVGNIAQGHDLPRGSLDHHWGDIADVITEQAADAVHEVVVNASGRPKDKVFTKPGS
jgi:hypothetical protein